ncbi:MAG: hypothetical protein OEM84_05940 [Acidimicrobiia bacterium]|nr:hypothetical protein [Acidimicrobiia bacterium]
MERIRGIWQRLMSIGAYPGETDAQAARRRIVVGYMVFTSTRICSIGPLRSLGVPVA